MTRNWRAVQIFLRSEVVDVLCKKYGWKITEVLEELAYQEVCKRVLNKCIDCGSEIYVWVLQDDFKAEERFTEATASSAVTSLPL